MAKLSWHPDENVRADDLKKYIAIFKNYNLALVHAGVLFSISKCQVPMHKYGTI